jgi:CheY-like chemotaxis protein
MNPRITGDSTHTILVCHSNRSLVRMAQLQASRHGVNVIVARDGNDLIVKAAGQPRPDAIVLSSDLKNPSTDEILNTLRLDPRLKGVPVVVAKGMLDGLGQLLKGFKRPPWNMGLPKR